MSTYGWEHGSIVIPSAEWASFKAKVREAYNLEQRRRLADCIRLYDAVLKQAGTRRNVDWDVVSQAAADQLARTVPDVWQMRFDLFSSKSKAADGSYRDPFSLRGTAGRPNKPTRTLYPEANSRTTRLQMIHASISFDDKTRTVVWDVPENNHAVRDAHQESVAVAFFDALGKVKWTAVSGGEIHGNDEYNQNSARESGFGGGSYVTKRYGRAEVEWRKSFATAPRGSRKSPVHASGGAFSPFGSRARI